MGSLRLCNACGHRLRRGGIPHYIVARNDQHAKLIDGGGLRMRSDEGKFINLQQILYAVKIIIVHPLEACNNGGADTLCSIEAQGARVGALPDTALQTRGKPVFIPDWGGECEARCALAVRISRLGKSIERRFATRYFDTVAPAVKLEMQDMLADMKRRGAATTAAEGFDGAVAVGEFAPLDEGGLTLTFTLGTERREVSADDATAAIAESIEAASQFFSIRQGDILLMPCSAEAVRVVPDTHVEGFVNGRQLLGYNIK